MIRRKIAIAISLIVLLILNIFYVEYQLFLAWVLICVVLVESYLAYLVTSLGLLKKLRLARTRAVKGKNTKIRLLDNKRCLLGHVVVTLRCNYSNTKESVVERIELCNGVGSNVGNLYYEPKHCGTVAITIEQIDIYDYLKIFHRKLRCDEQCAIVVFPQLTASDVIIDDTLIGNEFGVDESAGLKGYSDEVFELRDYRDTDSLKNVHWKLSSRCIDDGLIVKDHMQGMVNQCSILVDTSLSNEADYRDKLDKIYERTLAIGIECLKGNVRGALIACDAITGELFSFGFDGRSSLMSAMAKLMEVRCTLGALDRAKEMIGEMANPIVVSDEEN